MTRPPYENRTDCEALQGLDEEIIKPALARFDELVVNKAEKLRVKRIGT